MAGQMLIEELKLGHRLQAAHGHADGAPHDGGFRQRCVEGALRAELALQSMRHFEDAALALHHCQNLSAVRLSSGYQRYQKWYSGL